MPNASAIDYNDPFPSRLRALMENTTQKELADYIGVSRQSISQYTDGSSQPVANKVAAIAKYFNVTADYLLGRTEAKRVENIDVVEKYGLSEKALSILERCYTAQKHNSLTLTINALIENGNVLGAIARYLYYTLDAHEYERYGGVVPFHIVYKYIKMGESGRWGEIKPPNPHDVEKNTEAIDNDVIKRVFLYEIQERLIDLLKEQEQIKHF